METDDVVQGELGPSGKVLLPVQTVEASAKEDLPSGGFVIRHYWGKFPAGRWICPIDLGDTPATNWAVFISIGESVTPGSVMAGTFIGSANLLVENTGISGPGQVEAQILVDWGAPVAVQLNYLFIPPP